MRLKYSGIGEQNRKTGAWGGYYDPRRIHHNVDLTDRSTLLLHGAPSRIDSAHARHPIHLLTPSNSHQQGAIMMWELLQLGCDVVTAGCSLVAAMGFVAFVGWLFVSIAFIRAATNTPMTTSSPRKHIRFVSTRNLNGNRKPSIKL